VSAAPTPSGVRWNSGSLDDLPALQSLCDGADAIIHCAGLAHVFRPGPQTPAEFVRVNVQGTRNAFEAAAQAGIHDWVLVSSVSVYGGGAAVSVPESAICKPAGDYARTKFEAEQFAAELAARAGARLTILRMATLYGEGDRGNILRLMQSLHAHRFPPIGGTNRKTLLYVEDAARACLLPLRSPVEGTQIFNVAGPAYPMKEIVGAMAKGLGISAPAVWLPAGPVSKIAGLAAATGIPQLRRAAAQLEKFLGEDAYDGSLFRRAAGFEPAVGLEEGMRREAAWYLANRAAQQPD